MAKAKKKVSKIKIKKKTWHKVIAPKIFGNKEIGESYLQSPEKAVGRKLKVNLKDLTGNIKDQNVHIGLQINKIDGSLLKTAAVSYELTPQYVKRCVRKNCARVDDYFAFKTKGGKKVVIKTLMVTINKVQRSVRSRLSKELGLLLETEIKKNSFDTTVNNFVNRRLMLDLKKKLKKIFPLKEVTARVLKLQEKGVVKEEIVVEHKPKEVEEKKAEEVKEPKTEDKVEEKPKE